MQRYAQVARMTFNKEKTGSISVGVSAKPHPGLPVGDVRWGFLRMDAAAGGKFVIDQAMIDEHIVELRRQLSATSSVFGWTQAYNKYMAFVVRNCGAPALVYGRAHIDSIIDTIARMQRTLFPGTGSCIGTLAGMLETKFGVTPGEVPVGWYLWPNAAGGLEVGNPFVQLRLTRDGFTETADEVIANVQHDDDRRYADAREKWDTTGFDDFIRGQEEDAPWWHDAYARLLRLPAVTEVAYTPKLEGYLML